MSLSLYDLIEMQGRDLQQLDRIITRAEEERKQLERRVRELERKVETLSRPRAQGAESEPVSDKRRRTSAASGPFRLYFRRTDGRAFHDLNVKQVFERRFGTLRTWRFEDGNRLLMVEFREQTSWERCKGRLHNLELEFDMKGTTQFINRPIEQKQEQKQEQEHDALLHEYINLLQEDKD